MSRLADCDFRIRLDDESLLCRHPGVRARNRLVDAGICATCSFAETSDCSRDLSASEKGCVRLLAVPGESLRRDPSGWHKFAYVRLLAKAFDAELVLLDQEDDLPGIVEQQKPDLLLTMNLPWYDRFSDKPFWRLPRQLPVVTIHDDCRRRMHPQLEAVLDRSAAVISPARYSVIREFPSLANRLVWLPYFIPAEIRPYQLNRHPLAKCLITGAASRRYPLRRRAIETIAAEFLERLEHPGYWQPDYSQAVTGQAYFDLLHRYLAALTCGSVDRCVVAKYLEIPYAGTLLVAEDQPDLPSLGFQAGEHFIAVDRSTNFAELIERIVRVPEQYFSIRRNGQVLVRRRHTEAAREPEAREAAQSILRLVGLRNSRIGFPSKAGKSFDL